MDFCRMYDEIKQVSHAAVYLSENFYEADAGECAATTIPEKEIYPRIIICCAEC